MSRTGFLFVAVRQLEARITALERFLRETQGYVLPAVAGDCLYPAPAGIGSTGTAGDDPVEVSTV